MNISVLCASIMNISVLCAGMWIRNVVMFLFAGDSNQQEWCLPVAGTSWSTWAITAACIFWKWISCSLRDPISLESDHSLFLHSSSFTHLNSRALSFNLCLLLDALASEWIEKSQMIFINGQLGLWVVGRCN